MGSVFQLRDYWSQSYPGEEFSPSAVAVGDLDNINAADKVAIGSFQGVLRVLLPGSARDSANATDTLLEEKFDEPILQLACGGFQPITEDVSRNLLAILFPRRLVLMAVERSGEHEGRTASLRKSSSRGADDGMGDDEQGMEVYYKCEPYYEARFERALCNFTYGPFGRASHDMICVQSMDGQLSIVDHNKIICQRFFPTNQFLVPGCLTYCSLRDTFLTNNSSMFLLCYEFSNITNSVKSESREHRDEATGEDAAVAATSGGTGGRLSPTWAFNLGDDAVDVKVCRFRRGTPQYEADIIVLCPYSLYVLTVDGQCSFSKRLDVETCCLCVYPLPDILADNLLVGAFNGSTYVYSEDALQWSAVMKDGHPLHMSVASLCGTQGMVLSLNSESTLSVNYLGTDPADAPLQPLESKSATYAEMNRELKQVQHAIRRLLEEGEEESAASFQARSGTTSRASIEAPSPTAASGGGKGEHDDSKPLGISGATPAETAAEGDAHGVVTGSSTSLAQPPTNVFPLTLSFGEAEADGKGGFVISLSVHFTKPFQHLQRLQDVVVQVNTVDPVAVEPSHTILRTISVGETSLVPLRLSASPDKDHIVPSSLELTAAVIFTGKRYDTWACRETTLVPLSLVARPVPPVKNTAFSVQLNTNMSPPPSLVDLFPDLAQHGNVAPNVLSVHYLNGADASVLVSKNAARFKLQGSTMEGLWLLTDELVRRVKLHYAESEQELVFSIPDDVPLVDFTAIVDTHAAIRKEVVNAVTALDNAAQFLRSVEKRLLVRFRDRNPTSSDTMTILFEDSYAHLQRATDAVVLAKSRQRQACAMLNCCARLVFFWMRIKYAESFTSMTALPKKETSQRGDRGTPSTGEHGAATVADVLKELFTCDISADDSVGWEEVAEAALVQLLEVKQRKVANKTLEVSHSTVNLKKLFSQLVEAIKSGKAI